MLNAMACMGTFIPAELKMSSAALSGGWGMHSDSIRNGRHLDGRMLSYRWIKLLYYTVRPLIPRVLQIYFRRKLAAHRRERVGTCWPIDPQAIAKPVNWEGWPQAKQFALVLSHDVESQAGHDDCLRLADLEEALGFRSSFNFVPEKYRVSLDLIENLKSRGFEIRVHGLRHDGKLFFSRAIFERRAQRINFYLKRWGVTGFTSPSMHHNLEWLHALEISHSTSTFDTDPFEPQPDAAGTLFPYWIGNINTAGYVELPYTLPQDHLLFIILQEKDIRIWIRKLEWIAAQGGMALLNVHPDYICFEGRCAGMEKYPLAHYERFLEHLKTHWQDLYFHSLPKTIADFWCHRLHRQKG
jgi:hypothetical protein